MQHNTLDIQGLTIDFKTENGVYPAVKDINLSIKQGEIMCIVGESGSGKTITSLSIMQILPSIASVSAGEIWFKNQNLLDLNKKEISDIRGNTVSMIFQDAMSSLDPLFTCGHQIIETIRTHKKDITKKQALEKTKELLRKVGIAHPETIVSAYPYELSGGMCQRVMIAMALSCNPKLLIADEPTTALDVTVQSQILKLLKEIRKDFRTSIMFITHDLGVVAEIADRVAVMYAGRIVEVGDVKSIFNYPKHPYTASLIKSIPKLNEKSERFYSIKGSVPGITEITTGCKFSTRCAEAFADCFKEEPASVNVGEDWEVRCWLMDQRREDDHGKRDNIGD